MSSADAPLPSTDFQTDHPTGYSLKGWPVYLVGRWLGQTSSGIPIWEFVSLEESTAAADAACRERNHFYVPVRIAERAPEETSVWPGVIYPRRPQQ